MYVYKIKLIREIISEKIEEKFSCSEDVARSKFVQDLFISENNDKEKMYVLFLNVKNKIVGYSLISMGSMTSSIVHPREVLKPAILCSAASIIMIHNHPSGDPDASTDDIAITKRIKSACEIMGINLLDHLILGFSGEDFMDYYSFTKHQLI